MRFLSVVIPTFNESANIGGLLRALAPLLAPWDYEIIVVDDNSPDGTAGLVNQLRKDRLFDGRLRLLRRTRDRGLSPAVVEAFEWSTGRLLAVLDADRSHDETLLPRLIESVSRDSWVAVGSRRVPGGGADKWPWYRQWTSSLATGVSRALLGVALKDPMSGFFALRRDVFEKSRSRLRPRGYKILLEILVRARVPADRVREFPYVFKDRRQGYSKLSPGVAWSFARQLLSLAADRWRRR